jgi:preprotein translocase subunit SecE
MASQEDVKRERAGKDVPEQSGDGPLTDAPSLEGRAEPDSTSPAPPERGQSLEEPKLDDGTFGQDLVETHDVAPVGAASPTQLGTRRFVYAAYFAGAIGIAFLMSKLLDFAWLKLQSWKPAMGEPRDEVVMPLSALIGTLAALYYWHRTRARQLAEEVATEMSKVTWPTRTEVTNGTFVVIVTTIVSTVFFALMDKFWGFVTNLVYGGS